MVKDRLAELQEKHVAIMIEEAEATKESDEVGELPMQTFKRKWSGKKYSKKLAVSEFLQKSQIIEDNLKCLRREMDEINRLQKKLDYSPFKDEAEMQKLQKMGKTLLIRAGKLKADIDDLPNTTACKKESDMQQRVQNNQIKRLMNMLRDIVMEFKTNQGNCIEKSREMCRRQRVIMTGTSEEQAGEDGDTVDDLESQQIFTGNYINKISRARRQLQSIRMRERSLNELEGQISELNELFKTMQILVTEQGTKLDTIEQNVNKSQDYVLAAEKSLGTAVVEKQKYDRKRCICAIVIIVILAIIGIIIGVAVSQSTQ